MTMPWGAGSQMEPRGTKVTPKKAWRASERIFGGGGENTLNCDLSEIYIFSGVVRASETGVDVSLCCLSTVPSMSAFGDCLASSPQLASLFFFFGVAFFP